MFSDVRQENPNKKRLNTENVRGSVTERQPWGKMEKNEV